MQQNQTSVLSAGGEQKNTDTQEQPADGAGVGCDTVDAQKNIVNSTKSSCGGLASPYLLHSESTILAITPLSWARVRAMFAQEWSNLVLAVKRVKGVLI